VETSSTCKEYNLEWHSITVRWSLVACFAWVASEQAAAEKKAAGGTTTGMI